MATSLHEITEFLENNSFVFDLKAEDNSIVTFCSMNNYIDKGGDYILPIVILLQEGGRFIRVSAPDCYGYKNLQSLPELFQIILVLSFQNQIKFECDRIAETLSAVVEFPLEDSRLTEKQLLRCINSLSQMVDRFDPWIRLVLSTAKGIVKNDQDVHQQEHSFSVLTFLEAMNKGKQFVVETEEESDEEWI